MDMKSVIVFLIIFSTPFAFADSLVNEEWKVYEKINGEWVEIENAEIKTKYTVYLSEGSGGLIKWEKSFTNNNPETREFSLGQSVQIDPTYQYEEPEDNEFGIIAVLILAVAIISIIAISTKSRLSIVPRY